jgi:hypothetical protein
MIASRKERSWLHHLRKQDQPTQRRTQGHGLGRVSELLRGGCRQGTHGSRQLSHFEDIFEAIDTDNTQFISKKELRQLIRKFRLDYTERDVDLMMEAASSDGDKVSKQELANFLCRN